MENQPHPSHKGSGELSLRLERFRTDAFDDLDDDTNSVVWQQQDLFFAVGLKWVPDVGICIDNCWATTTLDSDIGPQHFLIWQDFS